MAGKIRAAVYLFLIDTVCSLYNRTHIRHFFRKVRSNWCRHDATNLLVFEEIQRLVTPFFPDGLFSNSADDIIVKEN